jgi:hypothetical protein
MGLLREMGNKKNVHSNKALLPIVNGKWGTPEQLARIGISPKDVLKLKKIMESIVREKKIIESKELNYFLAMAGHSETHYLFENGVINKVVTHLPYGSCCSSCPAAYNELNINNLASFSDELQQLSKGLIKFLNTSSLRNLKKCSICENFFLAKDTKRKICYEKKCINKYHRDDMKKRRDINPVKYC